MLSARTAANRLSCAPDYVGKLCREGKLECTRGNSGWFVAEESIYEFEKQRELAKLTRAKELAETRRQESVEYQKANPSTRQSQFGIHSLPYLASGLIGIAVFAGSAALSQANFLGTLGQQTLGAAVSQIQSPFFGSGAPQVALPDVGEFFASLFKKKPVAQTPVTPPVVYTSAQPTATTTIVRQPVQQTVVQNNYPVVERTIERIVTRSVSGVSEDVLAQKLQELNNALVSKIFAISQQTSNNTVVQLAPSQRIDKLSNVTVSGVTGLTDADIPNDITASNYVPLSGGSLTGALTLSGSLNGPLQANEGVVSATTSVGTLYGGTGITSYTTGDILYASAANTLAKLGVGSNGQVLKLSGGVPSWGTDTAGSGGASAFATTSDDLGIYTVDTTDVVIIGASATSTTGNILEVKGNSLLRGLLTAYQAITAPTFTATSTLAASTFPYASSTALTVSGTGYFGTASTSNLTVSNTPSSILSTNSSGVVGALTVGNGLTLASNILSTAFGTTSANIWTALQEFSRASSTLASVYDTFYIGRTATTTIRGDGVASILPYASSTALTVSGTGYFGTASSTNLTVSGINGSTQCLRISAAGVVSGSGADCGSGSGTFSWTPSTYGTQAVNATSTGLWLTGSPLSLIASSTFVTFASSTALSNSGSIWFTGLSAGGIGVDGAGKLYSGATSTLSTISGTLALSQLAAQAANTVLANLTANSAAPTAISTTSLFAANPGQVLTYNNGVWSGVATTTFANGTGISTALSSGQLTITNTIGFPYTPTTNYGATANSTSTAIFFSAGLQASSTSRFVDATFNAATTSALAVTASSTVAGVLNALAGLNTGIITATGAITSTATGANTLPFASSTALTVSGTGYFGTASTSNLTVSLLPATLLSTNATGVGQSTTISAPLSFSGSTLSITQSGLATDGYLSSTDYTLFNNKISSSSLAQIFPFTPTTSFGTTANSTSTLMLFTAGLSASSTVRFGNTNGSLFSFNSATGNLGLGTSTPYAQLTIFATSTTGIGSPLNLFAIASTTSSYATTTLFSISNTGLLTGLDFSLSNGTTTGSLAVTASSTIAGVFNALSGANFGTLSATGAITSTAGGANTLPFASSTALTVSGTGYFGTASSSNLTVSLVQACSGSSALTTNSSGVVACGSITASAGAFPFTSDLNYGATANSTSTAVWFKVGLQASSTSQIAYASSTAIGVSGTGYFGTASTSNLTVSLVQACSGSSALTTNSSGVVACGAITGGGGTFPFTSTTNFGATANSTSTPIWFGAGLQASSTSQFDAGIFRTGLSVGSTSPYAYFSVHAASTTATTTLFAISSTTSSGVDSSLFSVSNTGLTTLLNLSATGATTSALAVTASSTVAGVFNIGGALNANLSALIASTTLTGNSLFTNATTTGSLAVTASSTIAGVLNALGGANFGTLSATGAITSTAGGANTLPFASSTAFTVSGTGYFGTASTTNLTVSGISACSGSNALTTNSSGVVACGSITGVGGGTFSWTPTTNYGATANSTSTVIWFQSGLQASSTSYFVKTDSIEATSTSLGVTGQATVSGNLGVGSTTPYAKLSVSGGNFTQLASGNPSVATSVPTASQTYQTAVQGRYLYIADYGGGLKIQDISNPRAPTTTGTYAVSNALSVAVSGKYAYVGAAASVNIIDVSNPKSPALVSTYPLNFAYGLVVSGKYLYAADFNNALVRILDVSNPAVPRLAGTYPIASGAPFALFISGKYLYIADQGYLGIQIVDISNPASPSLMGGYATTTTPTAVYVSGRYAYVTDSSAGLYILDIANPAAPLWMSTYRPAATSNYVGVVVAGRYAYVGSKTNDALLVLDVQNPAAPVSVGSIGAGDVNGLSVSGKYAYVAGDTSGLFVIDLNGAELPSAHIGSLESNSSNVSESLTVGNDIYAGGGLSVGISGIFSRGTIAAYVASSTQSSPVVANFMGGAVGIGTSSPFARLGIHANPTDPAAFTTLFAIGSSTSAYASTTLFSILNTGAVNLTGAITSTATGANTLPFASSTALTVSGTGYFGTASTSNLTVSLLPATLLSTNATGVGQSTTISAPLSFSGSTLSITQSGLATDGYLSSADYTLFNNKISSSSLSQIFPFTPTTSFGTAANSTSTLMLFTAGLSASSTVRFGDAAVTGQFLFDSATGKLGLGTTTPWARLSIDADATLGASPLFAIGSSTATHFLVDNAGRVGIGTVSTTSLMSGRLTISSANLAQAWVQVGSGLTQTTTVPALAALSPNRVAFINGTSNALRILDFNGSTWTQTGSDFEITESNPALAALSPNRVAFIDDTNDELRTYEFATTTAHWMQVGTGLSIPMTTGVSALAALSPNRVAFIDNFNDSLRTYEFNGSTWSLVGSGLSISNAGPALAALSPNRVAYFDTTNESLRTYEFNGSTWSQVGSGLSIPTVGNPTLTALSPNRVAFTEDTNDALSIYEFNGVTWTLIGSSLTITGGRPILAALSPNRVALIDSTNDSLKTYQFSSPLLYIANSQDYPYFAVSDAGHTTAEALVVRTELRVGQSATSTAASSTPALIVSGNATFSSKIGVATSTPWGSLSINGSVAQTHPLFHIASSTGAALFTVGGGTGDVGLGTTTPFATLAVQAASSSVLQSLFAIASTSNNGALSTLFSIANTGLITGLNFSLSNGTTTGSLAVTASSTIAGAFNALGNVLLGQATTTGSLAVTASSTVAGAFNVGGTLTAGGALTVTGNTTLANATSTSFAISSIASGSLLKTTTDGAIIAAVANTDYAAFSFPYTSTTSFGSTANSTSTLMLLAAGLSASSTVRFGNTNGSIFSFDSATGKLGLGTSTPYAQLTIFATSTSGVGSPLNLFAIASTTSSYATTTLFTVTNAGNVGIGTASPLQKLHVKGMTEIETGGSDTFIEALRITQSGFPNQYYHSLYTSHSSTADSANNALQFRVNNGETTQTTALTIVGSGAVGIGIAAPEARLHVKRGTTGNADNGPSGTFAAIVYNSTDGSGENGLLVKNHERSVNSTAFEVGGDLIGQDYKSFFKVRGDGNVGIGTTTPGSLLSVHGGGYISSNLFVGGYITSTSTIASTFPYASSTALTVSGTGYFGTASTTNLTISGIASGSLLKTTTDGAIIAAVANTDYAAFSFPYTSTTSFGSTANSTSTLMLLAAGLSASSTVRFGDAAVTGQFLFDSATGKLGLGTSTPWARLSIDADATLGAAPLFAIGSSTATSFLVDNAGRVAVGPLSSSSMVGRFSISSANLATSSTLVGTPFAISGISQPSLAALSPNRVAFVDISNASLRLYEFNGSTWVQIDSGLSLGSAGNTRSVLTALSPNRVAYFDDLKDSLRIYEYATSTWSRVASTTIDGGDPGAPALTALSPTRVAFIDGTNDSLRMYEFNGTAWIQVGGGLAVASVGTPALTALSPNRVAFIDDSNDSLRVYELATSTWNQVGNSLAIGSVGSPSLTALSPNRVAFIDATNDSLQVYEFNGNTWSQTGGSLVIGTVGSPPSLAALSPNRIAFIDQTNASLRTYQFRSPLLHIGDSNDYPYFSVSDAGYTTAEALAVRTELRIGQSATSTSATSSPALIVNGTGAFYGKVGIGTTTPWGTLAINGTAAQTNPLFHIASSSINTSFLTVVGDYGKVGVGTSTPWAKFSIDTDATLGTAPIFAIGSSTATHFIVDNAGRVGIGTTTPWGTLSIKGTAGQANPLFHIASSTGSTLFTITGDTGNIGIGTTSPFARLSIKGTTADSPVYSFAVSDSADSTLFSVQNNGSATVSGALTAASAVIPTVSGSASADGTLTLKSTTAVNSTSDAIIFKGGSAGSQGATTELARLMGSGNFGIATSSPYAQLSVEGKSALGNSATAGFFTATTSTSSVLPYASSTAITVSGTGYFGTASTSNLTVSGINGSTQCLRISATGVVSGTGADCATSSTFPFDATTSFGTAANSTSTLMLLSGGLSASSTVRFGDTGIKGQFLFDSSTGKLGLGTTTPWAAFSLETDATLGAAPIFAIGSSTATHFIVDNAGRVGIGTTSPYVPFSVSKTASAPQLVLGNGAGVDSQFYLRTTTGDLYIQSSGQDNIFNNDNLWVCSGATDITTNNCITGTPTDRGNLIVENRIGIGTSTVGISNANFKLTIETQDTTTDFLNIASSTSSWSRTDSLFTVKSNGRVGIGTSTPFARLAIGAGGAITTTENNLTDGATITINWLEGNQQKVTLGGNRTIAFSNYTGGQILRLALCQDSTGSRTITWPGGEVVLWQGGSAPSLTSTANKCDLISFIATYATSTLKVFGAAALNF